MILYTIMPIDQVFPIKEQVKSFEQKNDVIIEYTIDGEGKKNIAGIFSTKPSDYLKNLRDFL